jgi:hypothetical protein
MFVRRKDDAASAGAKIKKAYPIVAVIRYERRYHRDHPCLAMSAFTPPART